MGGRKGRAGKVKLWIAPDDLKAELAAIEAEAIGWLPLGDKKDTHFSGAVFLSQIGP